MKKTLLATAIAGAAALAATSASAATVYNQDGTKLDIYGNVQLAYTYIDQLGGDPESELADNGSTFGAKGEHKINDDIVGYFKAEWEYDADEAKSSEGLDTGDQAYVGAKGSFGDARIGSWDQLMDDWIQDPVTNNEYFDVTDSSSNITGGSTVREGNKLQYMSPVMGGLQFAVGSNFEGDGEDENVTDSNQASFYAGGKYTVGGFSIAAVYDDLGQFDGVDDGTGASQGDIGEQYGLTAQYTVDALRVAVKAERFAADADNADVDYYGIGARYGYGMGDVYGAYQYVDAEDGSDLAVENGGDDSFNEFTVGATYNISSAMYTFIEYAQYDRSGDASDGAAVGIYYGF
ncbi:MULTISPECIES: porin [Cobetia]|uniref:porin n=1 Tax=Cobetia TaxID=204286 RepID=UPI00158317CB|nr:MULTISPECIES: porin [Cobetia]MCO7231308.1 porin [Cobetia sp. Dlab-2-AX]MCO7234283.1 porin [Cobetia sp. Dlab-2-U]MDI4659802.1 porin [Cobetia sp. BMC6]NUJ55209.1 porin [Cobetia marina]